DAPAILSVGRERLFRMHVLARPKGAQAELGVSRRDRQLDDELDERIVQQLFRSASFRHPELRGELLRSLRHLVGAGDDLDLWRRVQVPHVGGADLSAADEADAQRSGVHHPKKANVLHDVETMTDLGAKHRQVLAVFDIGFEGRHTGFTCEALAWRDGKPWRGVDPNHRWLPITSPDVDFYLEAAAIATAVVSGPAEAPSMIALRQSPEPAFAFR